MNIVDEGFWYIGSQSQQTSKPCDPSRHLQESPALRARNRKKISQKGSLGVREKSQKNTRKYQKKVWKSVFLDFSGIFCGLCCRNPQRKTLVEIFFAISGPEGPETPVNGGSGRNQKLHVLSATLILSKNFLDTKSTLKSANLVWNPLKNRPTFDSKSTTVHGKMMSSQQNLFRN